MQKKFLCESSLIFYQEWKGKNYLEMKKGFLSWPVYSQQQTSLRKNNQLTTRTDKTPQSSNTKHNGQLKYLNTSRRTLIKKCSLKEPSTLSPKNIITKGTRTRRNINYNETALSRAALSGVKSKKKGRNNSKNTLEKRTASEYLLNI